MRSSRSLRPKPAGSKASMKLSCAIPFTSAYAQVNHIWIEQSGFAEASRAGEGWGEGDTSTDSASLDAAAARSIGVSGVAS